MLKLLRDFQLAQRNFAKMVQEQARAAQRRAREEWEAALTASRAAQREDASSEESGSTAPFG